MRRLLFLLALLSPSLALAQTVCTVPAFTAPQDYGKELAVLPSGVCGWQSPGGTVDVCALGVDNTGATDAAAPINAIITALGPTGTSTGGVVFLCRGKYKLSSPIHLDRQVQLVGEGGWGDAAPATWLVPDKNVNGIIVDSPATSPDGGSGEWSTVRDLSVVYSTQTTATWVANHSYAAGTAVRAPTGSPNHQFVFLTATGGTSGGSVPASFATATTAGTVITDNTVRWTVTRLSAITLFERAFLQNFSSWYSPGNGVHVEGFTPSTNVNGWSMLNGASNYAALNGYFVRGTDANAGAGRNLDCFGAGYWCYYDLSGGSNEYDTCQSAGSTLGGYTNTNGSINTQNLYSNIYSESGEPASVINVPSIINNGTLGANNAGTASWWDGQYHFGVLQFQGTGTNLPYTVFGTYSGAAFTLGSNTHYYSFFPDTDSSSIDDCWKYNNLDANQPICFTNGAHPRAAGVAFAPLGMLFQNSRDNYRQMFNFSTAAPVSGQYSQGDVILNSNASSTGSVYGWRAITTGTPGTWATMAPCDVTGCTYTGLVTHNAAITANGTSQSTLPVFQTRGYSDAAFSWGSSGGKNFAMVPQSPRTDADCLKFNDSDSNAPVCFTNDTHTRGANFSFFQSGVLFQNGIDFNRVSLNFSNAKPSSGTNYVGDFVGNSNPAGDTDPIGWRNITFGSPGTWIPVFSGAGATMPSTSAPTGTTATINWRNGPTQKIDVTSATGTVTVTLQNPGGGGHYWLEVIEGGTARQLTFSPSVKWSAGSAPTFALNTTNTVDCFYDGTSYLCRFNLAYN